MSEKKPGQNLARISMGTPENPRQFLDFTYTIIGKTGQYHLLQILGIV